MSDKFWKTYYPPNGWNCKCTVVQVLKDRHKATDPEEAMSRGAEALAKDKKGMFNFNSGIERRTFPAYKHTPSPAAPPATRQNSTWQQAFLTMRSAQLVKLLKKKLCISLVKKR